MSVTEDCLMSMEARFRHKTKDLYLEISSYFLEMLSYFLKISIYFLKISTY